MKKRILSIVLALCLVFSLLPVSALADTTASGTCGDNLTWSLDSNGTLTITGTGEMDGYYSSQNSDGAWVTTAPWGMYYKSIKNVVIEEGVTSIGYKSLYGCRCLTSITIPSSVTNIGGFAFCDCSSLISVKIPNSVTSIGAGVFEGCSSLMSVTIPDSATSIGDSMFSGCCNLASVIIPDSVSKIGGSAFSGCSSLVSVTMPKSVTIIGGSAFYGCYRLKSVTILGNLTSIGDYAFYGCALLEDIYYSSSAIGWVATKIGTYNDPLNNAELHCPEGSFFCYGKCGNTLFWGLDRDGTLTISGTGAMDNCSASKNTDGDHVTTAPWREHYKSIKSVVIENGVTSIGDYAFDGCSSLTSVTIPDSLTAVGWVAFGNCSSITDVYYTGDLSSWLGISFSASSNPCHNGANLYFNGVLLTDVVIPNSITSVGSYAFHGCSGLTSVIIPDNVTSIGYSAFFGCSSLTSITIPDGVTSIGDYAFYGCSSLTSVTIPDSITSIGDSAFKGCDKIKDVAFAGTKEAWNAIGYTFSGVRMHYNCTSLEAHYVLMEILEPTCESAGYKKYNCVCGYEYKEIIPINHNYEFSKAVASTCISYGYDLFVCSKCGAEKREYYNELSDHNYQITAVEPSCLTGGYTLHKCSGCGDSYKDELVPALGHSEVSAGAKAPTCTEAGHNAGTCCSRCGKIMSGMAEIAALGHSFDEWTQTKAPTCTECGTESRTCTRCNATETRAVAATGHHYTAKVIAPTCTVKGHTIYTCACGETYISDYVDALGHDRVRHDGKAPTCTEKGWEAYDTCSRCDYSTYEEIAATGHHYKAKVTAPTCTRKGYTTYTCVCGDRYVDSYVDATGHSFGAWTQTKAPTCTASGTEIRSCTRCNTTETRVVAILGHYTVYHEGKAATCTEKGWEAYDTCTRCDYTTYKEIAALDHNLVHHDAKAPTCTEKGWEAYDTCSRCDYTTYKEIAALGHNNVHHDGKAATCTEKGWVAYDTCTRCDYSTYKEIAATGHHYADTVTSPTCTAKGYTTHTCACGNSYVDNYTNALGHSYKNGICTRCNAKDPNYVAAPVIKITTSSGKPKISWSAVDGTTKYYIYRSTDGKTYKQYTTTTKATYADSNAKIGTTYYYKVKAAKVLNGKTVKSVYSNIKSIKCTPAAPVVSISRSNGKPKLTWKAVTGASKYYIYRSTDGKTYKQYTTTTKTTYTNTGAASGKKYYYKVKAVAVVNKKNVFSAYSTAKNLMTTIATPTVSITTVNGKPKVSWKAVTGADKYIVYRSTDGKTFKQLSTTTKTSLTNTGAKKNTKYYYKVKAVCTKNTSANSALSKAVSIKATK